MKVLVCGGRDFNDYSTVKEVLTKYEISSIISGGARGADALGERYAKENSIPIHVKKADWNKYGKSAGYRRNVEMAEEEPDLVVAFPGGKGTKHMINIATTRGLAVVVIDSRDL